MSHHDDRQPPREEWLILEWPEGKEKPTDCWLSNLPAGAEQACAPRKSPH